MLDRFEEFDIATAGTTIHGRRGGQGPPVLLLHGIPETHRMWHRVAPQLAERFTVVATDLRGFGASGTPPSTPDHAPYSMREVARDQVEVMSALGYEKFGVAGHDRGHTRLPARPGRPRTAADRLPHPGSLESQRPDRRLVRAAGHMESLGR
jgi:haloacetate dehalogenase